MIASQISKSKSLDLVLSRLELALVAVTGFLVGIFPEAGLVAACASAVWGFWRFPVLWSPSRDVLLVAFAISRVIYMGRSHGSIWVAILEGMVMLALPRATWVLSVGRGRLFGIAAIAGVLVPLGFAGVQVWIADSFVWQKDTTRALERRVGDTYRFTAVHSESAWAVQSLGVQGPGPVEYSFEIRADREFELKIWLHMGLSGNRVMQSCRPMKVWSSCRISANLNTGQRLYFVVGGLGLWKKGMPDLEIRAWTVQSSKTVSIFDRLRFAHRQASFAFNENAFGAWVAVVFLLASYAIRDVRVTFVLIVPMFLGVYFSGSRGVMLAGLVGWMMLFFAQWQRLKVIRSLILIIATGLIGLQVFLFTSSPVQSEGTGAKGFRSLDFNDASSAYSRLEIWQGALKASLLEPMFGPTAFGVDSAAVRPVRANTFTALPHAHNLWLEMLIEGGLVQVALSSGLLFTALYAVLWRRDDMLLALLIVVILINVADFFFFYAPLRVCFGMILGIGMLKAVPRRRWW
jgi:O-Antigen ligase